MLANRLVNSHRTMTELVNWGCSMEVVFEKYVKMEALRDY